MTYTEALQYLYAATPAFQEVGASAYKPGLDTTRQLDAHYGHPHRAFPSIHVAGTNGKGSTSHSLAAILQAAGYRVGLFTSPHLLDFSERIRVDGQPIDEDYVVRFTEGARAQIAQLRPSFFELTTLMAFCYFRDQQVDYAIIEVGMGGRLDSTNIISPILSIITGISLDHTQYLGDTLAKIAYEKAGIIKRQTPVIIGRAEEPEVLATFQRCAEEAAAPLRLAATEFRFVRSQPEATGQTLYLQPKGQGEAERSVYLELGGAAQRYNVPTILTAVEELRRLGLELSDEAVRKGLAEVCELTGLRGRWEMLSHTPWVICDTGHNEDGVRYVVEQLRSLGCPLHIIFGMVSDKDVRHVLALLPPEARYYFTAARVARALPARELQELAEGYGLRGEAYPDVSAALEAAKAAAAAGELIFVGGSNFLVADLISIYHNTK
ncbi:bifunctional folylpolyglutamate synthase/dihydrofolate synthase [Porphyromonas sp.]